MDVASVASRLHFDCAVCGRNFSIPYRTRPRRTCSHDCKMSLMSKHANCCRNTTSGRFEQNDFSGPLPGDPTVEQIWTMAAEIRKKNNQRMRDAG